MPFRVTFDLDDKDLRYFRANMKQAQAATHTQIISEFLLESVVRFSVGGLICICILLPWLIWFSGMPTVLLHKQLGHQNERYKRFC